MLTQALEGPLRRRRDIGEPNHESSSSSCPRLMPELYEYLNPMPFEAAAQMEKDLAEDLRAEGYTVAGGT